MRKLLFFMPSLFILLLISCGTTVKDEKTFLEFKVLSDKEVSVVGFKDILNGEIVDQGELYCAYIPDNVFLTKTYKVVSIGDDAFYGCSSIESIEIPNSVTSIGENAFYGCSSIESIEIPNSVTSIGENAFSWCKSLTSIVVDEDNKIYDSRENCNAIIETASNTLIAGCPNTVILNSVTKIGCGAFTDCERLTSIEIPNSVTSIGERAFYGCENLKTARVPKSLKGKVEQAFDSTCEIEYY